MTHHLTGKNYRNEINLSGKVEIYNTGNYKINILKNNIISNFLIPLFSKQWDILNENLLFIDKFKEKLTFYFKTYKLDEIVVYIELLETIKILMDKHNILVETEGKSGKKDPTEIISMIYKTTKIRLIPEYEIYNSIVGKPNNGDKYNEDILCDIKKWITIEDISFKKIKKNVYEKYGI